MDGRLSLLGNLDREMFLGEAYGHLMGLPFGLPAGVTSNATTGVPANGTKGYAKGCLFFNPKNGGVYINEGTVTSSSWTRIPVSGSTLAALTITALTTAGYTNTGSETVSVGDSTAAAGSTTSDAGALPAGTASVYPTTGADDTAGVKINTADKVTGRRLFIGNGVANKILKVYGPTGAVINGASADAAFSSASGKGVTIVCLSGSGNTWLAA